MKDTYYIQCKFKQGTKEYTAYIPERGARIGLSMELEDKEGRWKVIEVMRETRIDSERAKRASRDYLKQRDASDI